MRKSLKNLLLIYCIFSSLSLTFNCSNSYGPVSLNAADELAVNRIVNKVNIDTLGNTINFIADNCRHPVIDSIHLVNSLFPFIFKGFLSYGCDIYQDPFGNDTHSVNINLYAIKKGTDTTKSPIIVSAHWDTPEGIFGADDNASGCTALLEIARVLADVTTNRNVMFVMFGAEEIGFFGSYAHMKRFRGQPPHVLVNLDGIAYASSEQTEHKFAGIPNTSDFIMIAGMKRDRDFAFGFCDIIDQFVPDLHYYCLIVDEDIVNNPLLEHLQSSDHVVFWGEKQHALFITDTGPIRDPYYHTPQDRVKTLDSIFFRNVTAATAAFVYVEAMR